MALIANTMFEARANNGVFDELANITGVYNNSSAATEVCSAGYLCTRSAQYANQGYSSINNSNAWTMVTATATNYSGIYACNPHGVQTATTGSGNVYKVGTETLGLALPAGEPGTFTKVDFDSNDKIYRFGIGNLSTAIGTNTYFTIANGLLVPAASAPAEAGTPYFALIGTGTATYGSYAGMTYYDVMARRNVNVAA